MFCTIHSSKTDKTFCATTPYKVVFSGPNLREVPKRYFSEQLNFNLTMFK